MKSLQTVTRMSLQRGRLETALVHSQTLDASRARSCTERTNKTLSWRDKSKYSPDPRRTKSCRSKIDMSLLNENNREKLLAAFLPDLRKNHTRMGYLYRVQPFNLNQEKLRTVQIRAKTAPSNRDLCEHKYGLLGYGRKAANSTTPRPCWAVKPLPFNSANDALFRDATPQMIVYVKQQKWNFSDGREFLDRPLPKRSTDK